MADAPLMGPPRYACVWVSGFAAASLVRQDPALRGRPVAALRGTALRTVVAVTPEAAAGGARGLARGSIFDRQGQLVASVAQEVLLRTPQA